MAGHLDMRQCKDLAGGFLHQWRERGVQPTWGDFSFNDGHRAGPAVALQKFLVHDLGCQWCTRQLGSAGEAVPVDMD